MLARRPRHVLHPTLRTLAAGGRQWARRAGQVAACRLLGGLFLLALIFSRAILPPHMPHPLSRPSNSPSPSAFNRLMLISLEFRTHTFSGHGVYAHSIATSLARSGHQVLVLSATPAPPQFAASPHPNLHNASAIAHHAGLIEMEVEVEQQGWGRLDWKCPWESFARNISDDIITQVAKFKPSWVLVVDWSALPAFSRLAEAIGNIRWSMAFLNLRIYYLSEYKGEHGEHGEQEKQFYKSMESQAVAMASAVTALSSRNAHILATELGAGIKAGVTPMPLYPPLREDIRTLALQRNLDNGPKPWIHERTFLTCCVCISPETNADIFVSIVEIIAPFLKVQGITPFLCGGAQADTAYATLLKSRLRIVSPEAVIHEGFMGPSQLAKLYSQTRLNVHPSIYDAYGMTIVEAAAFAAPSVVHVGPGGAVGAAEFLDPNAGQVLAVDLTLPIDTIASLIKGMLLNNTLLEQVALASSDRSLSWNEDANAEQLISILKNASHQAIQSSV